MFRFLLKTISNAFRVWVRDTFYRDAFLKTKFDDLKKAMLDDINKIASAQDQKNTDSIQVLGIMPTASLDMRLTGGHENDACVVFFQYNMQFDDFDTLFTPNNVKFWRDCCVDHVHLFKAITMTDFETRLDSFALSQWGQRLSLEVLEFIAEEYAHAERVSSTYVMTVWTTAGCCPDWLHVGLNTLRDTTFSLLDAMDIFDLTSDDLVKEKRQGETRNSE